MTVTDVFFDILAALATSTLAGMGVGGGGLLVIYLVLVKNMEQLPAQGLNLLFFICCAAVSVAINIKNKRIHLRPMLEICVPGVAFAVLGSFIARGCDPGIIRRCFGALLIVSGVAGLIGTEGKRKSRPSARD